MSESRQKRELIEAKIRDGRSVATAADCAEDFKRANDILQEAVGWMKDGWSGFNVMTQVIKTSPGRMIREDKDACWEQWREAKETLRYRREYVQSLHYSVAEDWVASAWNEAEYGNPHDALKQIKRVQKDLSDRYLHKDGRARLRESLNRAWDKAIERIQQRKAEGQQRRREWEARMIANIERWEEQQGRIFQKIERLSSNVENNRLRLANARSDEYAQRVSGWIDENLEQIRELERRYNELTNKIRDVIKKIDK